MRSTAILGRLVRRAAIRQSSSLVGGKATVSRFLTTSLSSPLHVVGSIHGPQWNVRTFASYPEIVDDSLDTARTNPLRFEDLDLHPKSLKALRRHGLHKLTEIQEKTFDVVVSGQDVVGRARTGTGKTLSFLLPALERIVSQPSAQLDGIQMLILSPTRELAAQIAKEAERLVAQHDTNITSQVIYGGSSRRVRPATEEEPKRR